MLLELSVVEQRYRAVMEVVADGLQVTEVALRYGVSRQSVHRWIRRYEERGLNGLADRSHKPKSCGHQMSVDVEAKIRALRRDHPQWGPVRIRHELARRGVEPVPGRTSIYRALVRNRLIEPQPRRRKRSDFKRWEREFPMELWQSDLMMVTLIGGKKIWLVTVIDDHSRFCIAAKLVPRPTSRGVCAVFVDAMSTYGVPDEVLTDNGSQFTGRLATNPSEVLFDRMCRQNGIRHLLTGIGAPTTTGKVERFHRTLRDEFFSKHQFGSIEQAQSALDLFTEDFNCNRPHQSLEMKTPNDCFVLGTRTKLSVRRTRRPKRRPAEFEITRLVSSAGQIAIASQVVQVGTPFAGRVVVVEVHPRAFKISYEGEEIKTVARTTRKEVTRFRGKRNYQQTAG
ncbi:MAG: IS481 family transposase [Acidobacteria bacterium]|nr:IS481 family transposase [Acidobacteriota bacterium]